MKKILITLLVVLCLATTVCASSYYQYVIDDAGILTYEQLGNLEQLAQAASDKLDCGIYVCVLEDMADYGYYDIEKASQRIYADLELGYGSDRDGVMLLLSMADRDYTIYSGGSFGRKVMNDYAAAELSLAFLDDFKNDDWDTGLRDYVTKCSSILSDGRNGKIHTVNSDKGYVTAGIIGLLVISAAIGGVVVLMLTSQLKSVSTQRQANSYVPEDGVELTHRSDIYTHTTRTRTKIEKNNSSGGSHSSTSSGGSRTGKF